MQKTLFAFWILIQLPFVFCIALWFSCCVKDENQQNEPNPPPQPILRQEQPLENRNIEALNLFNVHRDENMPNQIDRNDINVVNLGHFFNALIQRFEEGFNQIERGTSANLGNFKSLAEYISSSFLKNHLTVRF